MRRFGVVVGAAALALVSASACGGSGVKSGAAAPVRFAVILKSLDLPVFNYAKIGAEREAKALGGIEVLWRGPESADQFRKEDPVRCAELIASGANRYPNLAAWISVGGWPVFTKNALASVDPAKTKVISFDTIPPAPDLLKEGKVQVLLGQKYFGWGSESVRLLDEIRKGRKPVSPIMDSGVDVVTARNLDEYLAKWKSWERQ